MRYEETKKTSAQGTGDAADLPLQGTVGDCPLAGVCRDPKAKRGRTHFAGRARAVAGADARKMQSPEGKATYDRRMHAAETPFGLSRA